LKTDEGEGNDLQRNLKENTLDKTIGKKKSTQGRNQKSSTKKNDERLCLILEKVKAK